MALAYYDGQFVESGSITISPLDYGFSRGVALFEFARIYSGVPFRIDDHIGRMREGAALLGLHLPSTTTEIAKIVRHLSAHNRFAQSAVKFYLTAGESHRTEGFGFGGSLDFTPHFMIIEDEVHPKDPEAPKGRVLTERGLNIKTVPFARDFASAKITFYLPGFLAARKLAGPDCDEILFVHQDGYVTESPTSNFFCVIDGVLCTPQQDMLKGVTRKVLLELAEKLHVPQAERTITRADLGGVTEAFLTGSFAEMMPIKRIDAALFAATTDAPVYKKLRQAFTQYIAEFTAANRM